MFKHALTQDVAYGSLLVQRRRELHRLIGLAIEELYAERLAEHYEVLAHHFSRAEVGPRRCDYLLKAAEKAAAAFGIREALALYERGARRHPATWRQRARRDVDGGPSGAIGSPLRGGRVPAARAAADELLVLARNAGNRRLEATALVQSAPPPSGWRTYAALARAQEAVEVSEASGDQFGLAGALSVRAFVLEVQGNPEQAVPEVERALAISRSIGNFGLQGDVAFLGTLPPIWQGRYGTRWPWPMRECRSAASTGCWFR